MAQVLQTRCVGFATDSSRHPLAPVEVVYEVERPRKVIPLGAKLWGVFIIVATAYGLIQGTINSLT